MFIKPTHDTELDTKGYIKGVNNNDVSNSKKEEEKKVIIVKDRQKETIKSLLKAEDNRNFKEIEKYFSDDIDRYWSKHNIDKNELKTQYLNSWKKQSYSKNEIEKIVKEDEKTYVLHKVYIFLYKRRC